MPPPQVLLQPQLPVPHFTFHLLHKSAFVISLPQANQKGKQSPQIKCAPYSLSKRGHSRSCHQDYKHITLLCRSSWLADDPTRPLGSNTPALAFICLTKHTALLTIQPFPKFSGWHHLTAYTNLEILFMSYKSPTTVSQSRRCEVNMLHGYWFSMVQARAFMQISCQWQGKNWTFNSFLVAILGKQIEEFFKAISKPKVCEF